VTDWNTFKEFTDFMHDLVAAVQVAKKAGKTADQAATEVKLPEKYKDYGMQGLKDNVTKIYNELK
jgi:hypothetical protein